MTPGREKRKGVGAMGLEPIIGQVAYETDTTEVMDLVSALRALEKQSASLADGLEGTGAAASKTDKVFDGTAKRTLEMNQALEKTSEVLGGLTALYSDALSKSTAFGQSMGQVATLSTEVSNDLASYNQQVLTLSASMGVEATQAADTFYEALSSGAASDAAGGLKITEVAMKAAVGGATEASVAVDGITTALNAWKLGSDQAGRASDVMFKAVAAGKMTFGELSGAMFQAGPLASSLGISLEEVAAASATLTKSGTPVSAAMTQIRASMTALINPNAEMQVILDRLVQKFPEMGAATGQAALDAFGYHKAMQLIVAESNEAGSALPKVLGSVEAVGAALGVSGQNAQGAMADLDAMNNSAGETQRAYDEMANTFGFASNQLKETSNAVLIELGTTLGQMLVPMLQKTTEILSGMLEGWNGLDDGTKQAIVTVGGLVALIGSGIGVFLSLQMTVAALGPLFTTATGGAGVFGATLGAAILPITAVVAAIGLLVKGAHDLGSAYDAQYEKVSKTSGGYEQYYQATLKAQESASGLGKVFAFVNQESIRQDLQIQKAGQAFLEHGLSVDKAVLSSAKFQQAQFALSQEAARTGMSTEAYQAQLVALADQYSMAAGKGHVLTEEQAKQSAAFVDSTINVQAHAAGISDATIQSEAFAAQAKVFGDEVASGGMTVAQATEKLLGYGQGLDAIAAKTAETAAAQGVASGALKSYSDDFKALFDAGSKWTSDVGQQNAQVEAAWTSLSQGVQQNLNDQWAGYQKYQEDLAAARQADAEAAAAAVSKRGEIEAAGAQKLVDLNTRLEDAKTDKQRASAEAAIAKENEKLAGMLAATENIGGANVAKVQEQYNQQVAAQREALAQMIVDHVNSMVLMGETSAETAKTIFATLRTAYPGVEVLSPVADAHAELMGTIRDATDESSASQVESIAKLPTALEGAVGTMQDKAAEYGATMDSWATAEEQLAGTHRAAADSRMATDTELAESGSASADQLALKNEELATSGQNRAALLAEAAAQESDARTTAADETETADSRIRDSSGQLTNQVSADAQSIEGSSGLIGAGYSMAADEVADAANRIAGGMSSISSGATNLTSSTADLGTKMAGGFRAMLPELEGFERGVRASETSVKGMKSAGEEMGRSQERSFGTAGSAASDAGSNITGAMDDSKRGMGEARTSAEELTVAMTEIPDIVQTEIVLLGVKEALGDLAHLMQLMAALRNSAPPVPGEPDPGLPDVPKESTGSSSGDQGQAQPGDPGYVTIIEPPPPGDWDEFTTAVSEADSAVAAFYNTVGDGTVLTAAYQPESPAMEMSGDGLRVMWALEDLYTATEDPFVIVGIFDDTDFQRRIDVAKSGIEGLSAEAERLAGKLQAALNVFFDGGAGDEGSLAWLFSKWQGEGAMPDLAKMFEDLNLPVKDMQEFNQYFDAHGPEEQMVIWKRLYDELRRQENDRWEQRQANLKAEIEALKAGNHDTTALDTQMKAEKAAHDERMDQLEERNRLINRQFGYYRDGVKDVTEATRDLAALEKEMDRARAEYQRAQVERLKAEQKLAEDYDTTAHDRVLEMLDEEEERLKSKHLLELQQIDELLSAEERRHQAVVDGLADEAGDIKDYIDEQEKALRLSKLDLEEWVASLGLDDLKADLKDINDAIRDLPSGRDLAGGGRERAKPEDMTRVTVTEGQRDVLQQALGAGVFGEEDAARARIALGQGKLRLDYLRQLLTLTQKYYQNQVSNTEDEVDARKAEFEAADRRWKREKEGLDDQLKGIEERRKAEDEYYGATKTRLEGERTALELKQKGELDAVEALRGAEERRHDARMKQLEEEYAMAIMIAEGVTPAEAARRIAELRDNVRRAMEDAAKLLEELRKNTGSTAPGAGGGSAGPIAPGQPVPPPGGIAPPPKGATGMMTGTGSQTDGTSETNPWRYAETNPWRYAKGNTPGDPLWVAIAEGTIGGAPRPPGSDPTEGDPGMTLSDFLGMLPSDTAPGRGAAGGGGALFTAGDTVNTQFWGPVYIEEGTEPDRLLRKSLGGGWGTRGTP